MREMNRRHVLSGFGGITVAAVTGAAGCGTVRANATAPAPPNQPPGTLRWRFQATPGDEPVIIATHSTVYASGAGQSSGNCRTYAIDASAGKLIWQTPASGPRPYATGPGVVYGFTVTGGNVTSVVATSATTGRTRWTHDAGRMLDNAKAGWLTYAGGMVYFASGTTELSMTGLSTVRALDARTGHLAWSAALAAPSQEPVVADGVLYASTTNAVVALRAATGTRRWQSANLGQNAGLLEYADGDVYASVVTRDAESVSVALDAATGRLLRRAHSGAPFAAISGMLLYVSVYQPATGSATTTLSADHMRTGKPAWTRTFQGEDDNVVPLGTSGVIYFGAGNRAVCALSAATGDTLWRQRLAAPILDLAVSARTVCALDQNGTVYAFQA